MTKATLIGLAALLTGGCADPVLDAEIAALPGEVPGIHTGPTHRGGQPCALCHSSGGGRNPEFSLAGTVYQKPTTKIPIEGAVVHVVDATGATRDLTSNCAGNFYITVDQWQPTFPLFIELSDPASGTTIKMTTKAGRDASCAQCHADPAGTDSPGHVWLTKDPTVPDLTAPPLTCGR